MNSPRPRLCYFANVRFPSERANSIQIVRMCSAFSEAGFEVELFYPRRVNRFRSEAASIHAHYGVPDNFAVRQLFSFDLIDRLPLKLQPPAFRIQAFTFGLRAVKRMKKNRGALYYVRDNATLALAAALLPKDLKKRLFYEAHDFPQKPASVQALVKALKKSGGVVAITEGLKQRFVAEGVDPARIHTAPDGVDLERFKNLPGRGEARARLGLDPEKPLAVYTGQLFPWKGVDTLVEAAAHLEGWAILLVGGRAEDRKRLTNLAKERGVLDRILWQDQVPPGDVPLYLAAADVLVLPNSGRFTISACYTSPMKLFEYMASKRPIVASDLPSLREVLCHEENALLVTPEDAGALAAALERLVQETGLGERLGVAAGEAVKAFTWRERALGIGKFMQ